MKLINFLKVFASGLFLISGLANAADITFSAVSPGILIAKGTVVLISANLTCDPTVYGINPRDNGIIGQVSERVGNKVINSFIRFSNQELICDNQPHLLQGVTDSISDVFRNGEAIVRTSA